MAKPPLGQKEVNRNGGHGGQVPLSACVGARVTKAVDKRGAQRQLIRGPITHRTFALFATALHRCFTDWCQYRKVWIQRQEVVVRPGRRRGGGPAGGGRGGGGRGGGRRPQ